MEIGPNGEMLFYKKRIGYLRNIFFSILMPGAFAAGFSEPLSATGQRFANIVFFIICIICVLFVVYSLIRFFKPAVAIALKLEGIAKPFYLPYSQIADIVYRRGTTHSPHVGIGLKSEVTFSNFFKFSPIHNSLYFKTKDGKTHKFNLESIEKESQTELRDIFKKHGLIYSYK